MHLAQLFRDKAKNILYNTFVRGISAAGSASPWHGGGHGFESRMLHSRKSREIRRNGFFPCFFILDQEENTALADEKCALAVHDAARTTQNQRSLPRISPIDIFRRSLSRHLSPRHISQTPLSPDRAAHQAESLSQSNRSPSKCFSHPP